MSNRRRYSPTRKTPDDDLKERARALQTLRDPEFSSRKQGFVSPRLHNNEFPSRPLVGLREPHRPSWSRERQRLAQEKQKLQEEQEQILMAKKRWSLPSQYSVLDPIDTRRPRSNQDQARWESDIADLVLRTQEQLPKMTANLQEMKERHKREERSLGKLPVFPKVPRSYKPWQMADYYMVRDLLLDLLDEVAERSERRPQSLTSQDNIQKHAAETTNRKQQRLERAVRLVTEELILQTTSEVCRQIAETLLSLESLTNDMTRQLVMQTAEATATDKLSGRRSDDPAYDLITSTYHQMCKDRNQTRKDIWKHSQRLNRQSLPTETATTGSDAAVESQSPPDDSLPLNLLHLMIKVGRSVDEDGPSLEIFREQEREYWKTFSSEPNSIGLPKKVQGVSTAAISPNQRYLALGCLRGDVLVYNMVTSHLPTPVRCIQNESAQTDAVKHIVWSLDASRLVTVNEKGGLHMWSMTSGGVSQKDLKDLELKPQDGLPSASQLTLLLALDPDEGDFNFAKGPLQATGAQPSKVVPTTCLFHHSHSLLATQSNIIIGLDNGDIIQCDTRQPPATEEDSQTNYIGQDVPTELFRCHKSSLVFVGFIGSHGDMVSMDTTGLICRWRNTRDTFSHFGWFEPSTKYQLDLAERVYEQRPDDEPKIHFSEEELIAKKLNGQAREAAREKATKKLIQINMEVLWHIQANPQTNSLVQVFIPKTVKETGGVFHTVRRARSNGHLLKHSTCYSHPAKNACSRLLGVRQSTWTMTSLVLMVLFPAFKPKAPHISFVVLDLEKMKITDTRIDVSLSQEDHDKCLKDNVCSFGLTPVISITGTQYIFACILGTLKIFSLDAGYLIMSTDLEIQGSAKVKKTLGEKLSVLVTTTNRNINVLTFTERYNMVDMLQLEDRNMEARRRSTYEAYLSWKERKSVVPYEQQHHRHAWTMDGDTDRHAELFMRRLVLQLADIAVYVSEGADIDKEEMKIVWNQDKISVEKELLHRFLSASAGHSDNNNNNNNNSPSTSRGSTSQEASRPVTTMNG